MRIPMLGISLLLLAGVGCSGVEKSICDKLVQCEGGNDKDRDACIQSWISIGNVAADYGCSDAYHNYLTCVDTTSMCTAAKLDNSCSATSDALDSCEKAASVRGSRHFLTQQ